MTSPTNTRAAGYVAKAMANTAPSRRETLLLEMMTLCAEGLRVIRGPETASEEAYRLGDEMAVRS